MRTKGPRAGGPPPSTSGLRPHPSPRAARDPGWPGARGELAGRLRSRGPPGGRQGAGGRGLGEGLGEKKRLKGCKVLRRNLHSNSFGSRVLGRLRFTARFPTPAQRKVARTRERSPLPWANPTTLPLSPSPPPAFLGPGPRGGGELSREEERSAPSW